MSRNLFIIGIKLVYLINYIQGQNTSVINLSEENIILITDDEIYNLTSKNFPNPYPANSEEYILQVPYGFSIAIEIKELDLDGESEDFLFIKSGTSPTDAGEGKVFTYLLKSSRKYLWHKTNVYINLEVKGKNKLGKRGFYLTYQRQGREILTTTPGSTTVTSWPTSQMNDSIDYVGYIYGKYDEEYNNTETMTNLKKNLKDMVNHYLKINNVSVTENVTEKNIQILHLVKCLYSWPNSEKCVRIRFAVPIYYVEQPEWKGYQLQTYHLEKIWTALANNYLQNNGMSVYSIPDSDASLIIWITISCSVLFFLLFLPYIFNKLGNNFLVSNKKNQNDTHKIIPNEVVDNELTLGPNRFQQTPNAVTYNRQIEYNHDIGLPRKTIYRDTLSEDSDEEEIYNQNQFSNTRIEITKNEELESNRPINYKHVM